MMASTEFNTCTQHISILTLHWLEVGEMQRLVKCIVVCRYFKRRYTIIYVMWVEFVVRGCTKNQSFYGSYSSGLFMLFIQLSAHLVIMHN